MIRTLARLSGPAVWASAILVSVSIASPTPAQTPSPSQVPPGEAAEPRERASQARIAPGQGVAPPAGSGSIRIRVGEIRVDGGLPALSGRTAALLPARGSEISVADLYRAAGALQDAYFEAGFPLVRVVVPPQDLDREGGTIRLVVISGYVERVDASRLSRRVRGRVEALTADVVGERDMTAAGLERRLLLAGEIAGLELRSALTPGTTTGATVLVLDGEHHAVPAAVSADNRVAEDLGSEQVTASVAFNSLLGAGERVVLTAAFAPEDISFGEYSLRRYASLYANVPVGDSGLSVGTELAYSSSTPRGVSALLELRSEYTRWSVFAAYPTIRTRNASQTITLGIDATFEEQTTGLLSFPVPLFTDRARVARLELEGDAKTVLDGQLLYSAEISIGLDGLGARSADAATILRPLSRLGAETDFSKMTAGLTWTAPIAGPFSLLATVRGQTSFDRPLLRSEQGSATSSDLISGPPVGSLVGDAYIAGRLELQGAFSSPIGALVPYVFSAGTEVSLVQPTFFERPQTSASAAGVGLRWRLSGELPYDPSIRIEWSAVDSRQADIDRDWTSLSIVTRF
jgi:hemolysin activation/secretion protein